MPKKKLNRDPRRPLAIAATDAEIQEIDEVIAKYGLLTRTNLIKLALKFLIPALEKHPDIAAVITDPYTAAAQKLME